MCCGAVLLFLLAVVYHLVVVKRDDGIKPGFFTTDAQIPVMLLSHPQPRSVFRAVRDDNMDVRVITVYTCDKTNKNVRYMNAAQTVICVAEVGSCAAAHTACPCLVQPIPVPSPVQSCIHQVM